MIVFFADLFQKIDRSSTQVSFDIFGKSASESALLSLRGIRFSLTSHVFSCDTLLPKCASRPYDHFRFSVTNIKNHGKTQVEPVFLDFFSFCLLCIFIIYGGYRFTPAPLSPWVLGAACAFAGSRAAARWLWSEDHGSQRELIGN